MLIFEERLYHRNGGGYLPAIKLYETFNHIRKIDWEGKNTERNIMKNKRSSRYYRKFNNQMLGR